jgi:hypothetical protein
MLCNMRWIYAILAAFTLFVAVPAWAQSIPSPPTGKPSAADEAAARKNFESGLKLYGEGAYAEALIAFEQSYRVGGRPSALKNIAQCHRSMKHFVEAYEALEQMITVHDAQVSAADKKAAQQTMEELAVLTGTIEVAASESDAEIAVDGRTIGKSPMAKPKRVAVGSHTVRVTKASFAPNEQQVNVGSQENKKVDVKLEPEKNTGRLVVREQSARDVHVFVDGEDKGPAPWEGDVGAGEHTVEAKSARFASEVRRIKVTAKERLDLSLDALPLTGHLRVTTVPATANISIDGKPVGSGAWEGDLPEGPHRIEVGYEGHAPQVREVTIGRGQLLVQEIPVVGAIAGGSYTDYRGIYVSAVLSAMYGLGNADNTSSVFRDNGEFIGAATATLRIGHAWDWYSAEGVAILMLEGRDKGYQYDISDPTRGGGSRSDSIRDHSFAPSAFFGPGGRATSKGESVRFTFGLAPGLTIRTFNPKRDPDCEGCNTGPQPGNNPGGNSFAPSATTNNQPGLTTNQGENYEAAGYTTFGLVADAGVYFGSTPGPKFFLGLQTWIDFPPDTIVTGPDRTTPVPNSAFTQPGRGITWIDGPQFYFGPSLGIRFGH